MKDTQNISLIGIAWNHFLRSLDDHGFREAGKKIALAFLAGFLSAAALYPDELGRAFNKIVTWHNYAIPTVLWIFGLVFSAPRIFRLLSAFFTTEEQEVESIEGIPTSELLDHLFTFGTFKRDDIEDKFKIPRYRYTALAKKLKELDVLTSGENNATVLNPDCSREHVASILEGKTTAAELEKPLTIVRPLPSFTRRQIRDSLQETDAKQACNPCAAVCAA